MRVISEEEFMCRLKSFLSAYQGVKNYFITGPGRSGAIASCYASHTFKIPFIPFGQFPKTNRSIIIFDTAKNSGRTLRKAKRKYKDYDGIVVAGALYDEKITGRLKFWYEV
jgi:hypothetical protein